MDPSDPVNDRESETINDSTDASQVTKTTLELAHPSPNFHTNGLTLDRLNVSSKRWVSGGISDEVHFWLNGYVNKQNCRIWSEANPQVYVETPLHPEKLTVWCALWAGGILLQKR
ncbi:hypothetical protein TNCV_4141121 [Trichonephila clavipes]|nr:hypothetical protein TNCV_4141121 [Trichonephila clavipes]